MCVFTDAHGGGIENGRGVNLGTGTAGVCSGMGTSLISDRAGLLEAPLSNKKQYESMRTCIIEDR